MRAVYLAPVYLVVNIYLLARILKWLKSCGAVFAQAWAQGAFCAVYFFFMFSVLTAFLLPAGQAGRLMKLVSNYWLGVLLYMILAVLVADLVWLVCRRAAGDAVQRYGDGRFHAVLGGICAAAVLLVSAWGICNARVIRVTPFEITVGGSGGKSAPESREESVPGSRGEGEPESEKEGASNRVFNIVLVSDLHLGYNTGVLQMRRMTEKINAQNADLVVIAGDIFDNEYEALEEPERLSEILRGIRAKYGVYACYGNHDIEERILAGFTFGGKKAKESSIQMDEFVEKSGIRLLRDEGVWIADSFYLYGRADASRPGRGIAERKTAAGLMAEFKEFEELKELEELEEFKESDGEKPVIVIDHQPGEIKELSAAGADVCLSGHTHNGQTFPANIVTSMLWENPYGYKKIGSMHTIVTSGVGVFGPNMRVGTAAEICPVEIHFQE